MGYPTGLAYRIDGPVQTRPTITRRVAHISPHVGRAPSPPFSKGQGQLAQSVLAKTLSHAIPVIHNPPRSRPLAYPSFATHQRAIPSHTPDKIDRNRPRPHTVASAPSSAAPGIPLGLIGPVALMPYPT